MGKLCEILEPPRYFLVVLQVSEGVAYQTFVQCLYSTILETDDRLMRVNKSERTLLESKGTGMINNMSELLGYEDIFLSKILRASFFSWVS